MMLIDDGRHRFVPVRLWLLAHGLLDFLGAAAAGGADGVVSLWRHAASRRARSFDFLFLLSACLFFIRSEVRLLFFSEM